MTRTTLLLSAMMATSGAALASGTSGTPSGNPLCLEDVDNDGYSSGYFVESETGTCTGDGTTANLGLELDCDDSNARIHPDATGQDFDCDTIGEDVSVGCGLELGDIVKIENTYRATCGRAEGSYGCFVDAVAYWTFGGDIPVTDLFLDARESESAATEFIVTDAGDDKVMFEVYSDQPNGRANYFDDSLVDMGQVNNGFLSRSRTSPGRGISGYFGAIGSSSYGWTLSGSQESCSIHTGGSRPEYLFLGLGSVAVLADGTYPVTQENFKWTMHVQ